MSMVFFFFFSVDDDQTQRGSFLFSFIYLFYFTTTTTSSPRRAGTTTRPNKSQSRKNKIGPSTKQMKQQPSGPGWGAPGGGARSSHLHFPAQPKKWPGSANFILLTPWQVPGNKKQSFWAPTIPRFPPTQGRLPNSVPQEARGSPDGRWRGATHPFPGCPHGTPRQPRGGQRKETLERERKKVHFFFI